MFLMRYIKEDRLLKIVCFCFLLSACNTFDKNGNSLSGFSEDGFENFKIGDNSKNLTEVDGSRVGDCFIAKDNKNEDIEFQIMNNRISIISSIDSNRRSYNGIKVGAPEKEIYEKYTGKNLDKRKNPYGDPKKDYSLIHWNDSAKKLGTRYDVENGVVVGIKVGNSNLTLMEGCA